MLDTTPQTRPDSRPDLTGLRYIVDCQRFLHRNSTKFSRVVVDSISHNSTKAIVKEILEEVVVADTSSLSRKKARSLEGNVDVEPRSSIDDSSMILIEVGVDV